MNPYIGHESQVYGIEEHRLVGGKGDGMRLLEINNGKGAELTVVLDRCADISRLRYKGVNLSYFSPCGYVAPAYYDAAGANWLKSFTAGYLTTCGLQAVGSPCTDEGEELPLHGSIANMPAEQVYWLEEEGELVVYATIRDEGISHRNCECPERSESALGVMNFRFRIPSRIPEIQSSPLRFCII